MRTNTTHRIHATNFISGRLSTGKFTRVLFERGFKDMLSAYCQTIGCLIHYQWIGQRDFNLLPQEVRSDIFRGVCCLPEQRTPLNGHITPTLCSLFSRITADEQSYFFSNKFMGPDVNPIGKVYKNRFYFNSFNLYKYEKIILYLIYISMYT